MTTQLDTSQADVQASKEQETADPVRLARVAVVQLAYHPAFKSALKDPLFDLGRETPSLLPAGEASAPVELQPKFKELQRRVRDAYLAQHLLRLEAILDSCLAWGVRIVVFPEYSIPAALLERLAQRAGDMVVVAGSHFVDQETIREGIYERLGGGVRRDLLEQSVSPVLHRGQLLGLVPKLHAAKPELGQMEPGKEWTAIELPDDLPGPMGVLICLDFLQRRSAHHRELVGAPLEGCRFLCAPSLTPKHTLEEFGAKALEDARRAHCPVLHANYAPGGGSTVYVDEGRREDLRLFPEHAGYLEADEEGVIVAEIDLGVERVGTSTPFSLTRPITPIAAASLVFRGVEPAYAVWFEKVNAALGAPGHDNFERLRVLADLVRDEPPPLPRRPGVRRRRLERLMQDIENESSVERATQLTREVVLPEGALPLPVLRAALARGAADEIQRWVELGKGDFGPVAALLRDAWQQVEPQAARWTEAARRAAADVSAAVRGGPVRHSRDALMQGLAVYEEQVERGFEGESDRAKALFEEGRYDEACTAYRAMLERAEKMLAHEVAAERPSLQRWVARWRLHEAGAMLNLQDSEGARELLFALDPSLFSSEGRMQLGEVLALVGERERARAVLPNEAELNPTQQQRLREVQQTMALLDGDLPEPLLKKAVLQVRAAWLLLNRNELAFAAEHCLEAIADSEGHSLIKAQAALGLLAALSSTVFELAPQANLIPPERREIVVDALERCFAALREKPLPQSVRYEFQEAESRFRELCQDMDGLASSSLPAGPEQAENDSHLRRAFSFAREGRIEEALEALPADDHLWMRRYRRLELLHVGGSFDRALLEAEALSRELPGRAPVEFITAALLDGVGREEEALIHADAAFAALPGLGQRIVAAELRIALGRGKEAWSLLQPVVGGDAPRLLRALARAAWDTGRSVEALDAQRRYVALRPDDARGRLELAKLLSSQRRPDEAAEIAWRLFEEQGNRLSPTALHLCGALVRHGSLLQTDREQRVKAVATRLRERFPANPEAEQIRIHLLTWLGEFPEDVAPPDLDLLVQGGRAYKGSSLEELRDFIVEHASRSNTIAQLERRGAIPTTTACSLTNTPLAQLVTRILGVMHKATGLLCPPVSFTDVSPLLDLGGMKLLLSDLELVLLEELDLVPRLRAALGDAGRLLLFARVRDRIHNDAMALAAGARPEELRTHDEWLRIIARIPHVPSEAGVQLDDAAAAVKVDASIVAAEAPADLVRISPRTVLRQLLEDARIDGAQHDDIVRYLPTEPEPFPPMPDPLPERILLTYPILYALLRADRLDALLDWLGNRALLGPRAAARFRSDRDERADTIKAAELADAVQARVVEGLDGGWIELLPDRAPIPLPQPREPKDPWVGKLVREPLEDALAYREAVLEQPDRWRLTADFFGSVALGAPGFIQALAWESEAQLRAIIDRLRPAEERDLTVPALVRLLTREPREADRHLIRLADLGFPDALGPAELLRLERRYRGLDRGEPARILDHQEWMAREPGHDGGDLARLRLTGTYAGAIFEAFCDEEGKASVGRSSAERESIIGVLLGRQEAIGRITSTNTLDQVLGLLAMQTAQQWQATWKPAEGGYAAADDGPTVILWKALAAWAGRDGSRQAAYQRSVRTVWCALDLDEDGPAPQYVATLALILDPHARHKESGHPGVRIVSLMEPEIEAVAILSATWKERPLANRGVMAEPPSGGTPLHLDHEQILTHGAALLGEDLESIRDERSFGFMFSLPGHNGALPVEAPVEALLLRAPLGARAAIAKHLKALQGPHDGALYDLLERIEAAPDDTALLREYARRATSSLFRLVRDEPAYLRIWGQSQSVMEGGARPNLKDLCRILSEPFDETSGIPEAPPAGQSIGSWLMARAHSGAWSTREDLGALVFMAGEVPGTLPAGTLDSQLHDSNYEDHVAVALHQIEHSDDFSIAQIARDVMFLRIAAAHRPLVKLPEGEIDLQELLPGRLARLLELVAAPALRDTPAAVPASAGTLASSEASVLRCCAEVVQRLALPGALPLRQGLWLTYRLFQWLCRQLEAISPDARRDGLRRLVAMAPPPGPVTDRLDPSGFGPDFDHRLATILMALGVMEELVRVVGQQNTKERPIRSRTVSSPALEDKLVDLAARPSTGPTLTSVLDWHAPGNAPDLALVALLRLNGAAFARLNVEARTRRFEGLPIDPDQLEGPAQNVAFLVVTAAADTAAELTEEERALLEKQMRRMADGSKSRLWRCLIFISLFAVGAVHLEEEARALLTEQIAHPSAPVLLGRFLLALAARDPATLESAIETLLAAAAELQANVVELALGGLGRVAVHGTPAAQEAAFSLLQRLAQRDPFREDPRMHEVVGFFGLKEGSS